jgi:hypothetical protein
MRKSFNCEWLKNEDGTLVGINLGADYCAEHEHGIAALKTILGVNDSPKSEVLGIERRRITNINLEQMTFLDSKNKTKGFSALVFGWFLKRPESKTDLPSEIKPYRGNKKPIELSCGWSDRDLGIYTDTKEGRDNLRVLVDALKHKDIAIWTGGAGPFQNAGLCLAIISKVSDSNKEVMRSADEDAQKLEQERVKLETETGLLDKIKASGKSYFALSPAWATAIKSTARVQLKTNYSLIYWLNPWDQKNNNYGYYTVEELMEWADNKGPIPIVEKVA